MKITGTITKFSLFALLMLAITASLVVIFGQVRFDSQTHYRAVFSNASGLRSGEFVRIAGVEVGKVKSIDIVDNTRAEVVFALDQNVRIYESTKAAVRWENLIGDHYLELIEGPGALVPLEENATIPAERTEPALDLDALLGGFKPLFKALDPDQVNRLSSSVITVFQGQGGSIADVLEQTAALTTTLADRDQLIGSVITNLTNVLHTVNEHDEQFSKGIDDLRQLVSGLAQQSDPIAGSLAHIDAAAATVAGLLGDARPILHDDITQTGRISTELLGQRDYLDHALQQIPKDYQKLSRLGLYGDFFSFYLCDVNLKVNGPNGDPVDINIVGQKSGRCTP
ncbi:MCE family protein [Rhodococcus opacus]|nr:MCE family protein [Rhodococcus opacus]